MTSGMETGKAFEYALLEALETLFQQQKIPFFTINSPNVIKAKECKDKIANKYDVCIEYADKAVQHIVLLEPMLLYREKTPIVLDIQSDSHGKIGDVRDLLILRKSNQWEIGISAKYNHDAVKHSRLSLIIDFGDLWMKSPCGEIYWKNITPIFVELSKLKDKKTLWKNIERKNERFYEPVLNAFANEFQKICSKYPDTPARFIKYIIGQFDFYKVMFLLTNVKIQAFNINNTLNRPAEYKMPAMKLGKTNLPTQLVNMKKITETTVMAIFNQGWQVSSRIHNASSIVEPSLKFDIRLVGMPASIYQHVIF